MTEVVRMGEWMGKPVAEFWYGIQPQGDGIIRFREIYVDPYVRVITAASMARG